ncbi:MAG: hypothetical protein GY820_35200 [Gammaproteobacteria bacterium]|nr:hypothetical protein [Gammaproteobacteria bacterium]
MRNLCVSPGVTVNFANPLTGRTTCFWQILLHKSSNGRTFSSVRCFSAEKREKSADFSASSRAAAAAANSRTARLRPSADKTEQDYAGQDYASTGREQDYARRSTAQEMPSAAQDCARRQTRPNKTTPHKTTPRREESKTTPDGSLPKKCRTRQHRPSTARRRNNEDSTAAPTAQRNHRLTRRECRRAAQLPVEDGRFFTRRPSTQLPDGAMPPAV